MQSKLNPYITFQGNAKEAMEFYQSVFGGKLELTTMKDGGASQSQADENKIMHSMLVADNGITLMGSDAPIVDATNKPGNISISLSGDDETELTGYYDKLSKEGEVSQPLTKAPWGDTFGMLTDKFGIFWMVNIAGKH